MTIKEPSCYKCIHFKDDWKCTAFPSGIPKEIREGENPHLEPVEGDNGITYTSVFKQT